VQLQPAIVRAITAPLALPTATTCDAKTHHSQLAVPAGCYRRYLFLFQWLQATFGFFACAVARMKDVFVAKEFPIRNSAFWNESRSETGFSAIMRFTSSLLCVITSFFAK
jgi:hypothetical protein